MKKFLGDERKILEFLRDNPSLAKKLGRRLEFVKTVLEDIDIAKAVTETPEVAQFLVENPVIADVLAFYPGFAPTYLHFLLGEEVHLEGLTPITTQIVDDSKESTIWITFMPEDGRQPFAVTLGFYKSTGKKILKALEEMGIKAVEPTKEDPWYADVDLSLLKRKLKVNLSKEGAGYVLTLGNLNLHLSSNALGVLRTILEEELS